MIFHNINPVLLDLGPLQIRYYGLFWALGFVIAYFLMSYLAKRRGLSITKDDVADFLVYEIVGIIGGARLIYVLFYNSYYYFQNPFEIIALWHGGLSFHGGLLGAIAAGYFFCKRKKIDFYDLADILVIPVALALALGRIGNFMNAELYGRITDVSWCIDYSKNKFIEGIPSGCRHPSQIYESIKNLVIFCFLWSIKSKKLQKGFIFWSFVALYGLLRTAMEFFRQPDEQIGFIFNYFTMGQLLSFPLFLIGAYMVFRITKFLKMLNKRGIELSVNFLVILLISIVIFGFGVKFIYDLTARANELQDMTMNDIDAKIGNLVCEGSERVCIGVSRKVIPRGKFDFFGVKILNVDPAAIDFTVKLLLPQDPRELTDPDKHIRGYDEDNQIIEETISTDKQLVVVPSSLLSTGRPVTIEKNEEKIVGIGINVPDEAPSGVYIFNIKITASGADYSTQKIYVEVP